MTPPRTSKHQIVVKAFSVCSSLLLIAFHATVIRADSTDGSTPLALQPGTPAGSYALSNFDHINPYNGSLNFLLPLLNIGGRGTAGYRMTLPNRRRFVAVNSAGDECKRKTQQSAGHTDYYDARTNAGEQGLETDICV